CKVFSTSKAKYAWSKGISPELSTMAPGAPWIGTITPGYSVLVAVCAEVGLAHIRATSAQPGAAPSQRAADDGHALEEAFRVNARPADRPRPSSPSLDFIGPSCLFHGAPEWSATRRRSYPARLRGG